MSYTILQSIILSTFDILQYYFLSNKIVNKELVFKKYDAIHLGIGLCLVVFVSHHFGGQYAFFLNSLIVLNMCFWLYREIGINLIYLHLITQMSVIIIQLFILIMIRMIYPQPMYIFHIGVGAQILGTILAFIVSRYIPVHLLFNYIENHNQAFKVILINVTCVLVLSVFLWCLNMDLVFKNVTYDVLIVTTVMLINTLLLRSSLKNQVVEEQNHLYEQYLPIVNNLMEEVRTKQHDFDNHVLALRMMINQEGDAQKALSGLERYMDELYEDFEVRNLIRLDNKVVSGFLYSKSKEAKCLGIDMVFNFESTSIVTTLKDFELLEILSILIDNAFETKEQCNRIKVEIKKEKHKSVIEIYNKHPYVSTEQFQKMFTKGYTTKEKKERGIGLFKLQRILNIESGSLEVSNQEFETNYVLFRVVLP